MDHADYAKRDCAETPDFVSIRWRPWPCASCGGGSTPLDFLVRCSGSSPKVPQVGRNEEIDWSKKWEAQRLLDWVGSCEHTDWLSMELPRLAEGSEHLVLFDEKTSQVVKITLPGTYGDYYEIINGRINQFDSTPSEYLRRMQWWEALFSLAPTPIGLTDTGRIVSRQRFIQGNPEPPQEEVDQFLVDAGIVAVRQSCWLWKKVDSESGIEIWIGDARRDNFVLTQNGMVPIDIRVWRVPIFAVGS